MQDTSRLFIAIELPSEIHQNLASLINGINLNSQNFIKWVKPENIHLTLKFLGEISKGNTTSITNTLTQAVIGIPPFRLSVHGIGCFPSQGQPRVFWAGIDIPDTLIHLHRSIDRLFTQQGIPAENRVFAPHLTLARISETADPVLVQDAFKKLMLSQEKALGSLDVTHITLFQSTLAKGGSIYTPLARILFNLSS